jgi:hypothetical protein
VCNARGQARRAAIEGESPVHCEVGKMTIGLVGRKSGMTRVFTEDGASIPVTVVEISPNRVTQIKESDSDGYRAIQVTAGSRKAAKVSKSEAGHFAKAGVEAGRGLWEFRSDGDDASRSAPSSPLSVSRRARRSTSPAVQGQGVPGRHQALELPHPGRHARQLAVAPRAGFDRSVPDAGSRVQGQEDGRSDG